MNTSNCSCDVGNLVEGAVGWEAGGLGGGEDWGVERREGKREKQKELEVGRNTKVLRNGRARAGSDSQPCRR